MLRGNQEPSRKVCIMLLCIRKALILSTVQCSGCISTKITFEKMCWVLGSMKVPQKNHQTCIKSTVYKIISHIIRKSGKMVTLREAAKILLSRIRGIQAVVKCVWSDRYNPLLIHKMMQSFYDWFMTSAQQLWLQCQGSVCTVQDLFDRK